MRTQEHTKYDARQVVDIQMSALSTVVVVFNVTQCHLNRTNAWVLKLCPIPLEQER